MKILLSITVLSTVVAGVWAQTSPANCVVANTPDEYLRLSTGTLPQTPDASLPNSAAAGCYPRLPMSGAPVTGEDSVRITTLTAPADARKAYARAQKALAGQKPDYAQAVQQLEKAVRSHSSFAVAWDLLGLVQNRLGEEERGKEALENAIRADPAYLTPYLRLAAMAVLRNRMDEALRLSDAILKQKPGLREAHYYRAVACYILDRAECATQSARAVLDTGQDHLYPRLHLILGDILAGQGDFRSAAAEYNRLIELAPDSAAADAARLLIANWKAQGILLNRFNRP